MSHEFNCIATGIGSLPSPTPTRQRRCRSSIFPRRPSGPSSRSGASMSTWTASTASPCPASLWTRRNSAFPSTRRRTSRRSWRSSSEHYLEKDYDFFRISEDYAAGFYGFQRAVRNRACRNRRGSSKARITGPLTAGISFKDETGRDIIHNDVMFDAVVKGLAMKAAWQIEAFKPFGLPVIIFIDEPAMESLGSAFSAASPEMVAGEAERDHRHHPRAGRHRRHPLLRERRLAPDLQHEGGHRELRRLRIRREGPALSRRHQEVLRPRRDARLGHRAHGRVHRQGNSRPAHRMARNEHEAARRSGHRPARPFSGSASSRRPAAWAASRPSSRWRS